MHTNVVIYTCIMYVTGEISQMIEEKGVDFTSLPATTPMDELYVDRWTYNAYIAVVLISSFDSLEFSPLKMSSTATLEVDL